MFARLFLTASLLTPATSFAHDLWVQPDSFDSQPGQTVAVRLRVGHGDEVDDIAAKPDRIIRFEVVGPKSTTPLKVSKAPQGRSTAHLGGKGTHIVVYQSNHAYIELAAKKFTNYLKHEGLNQIVAMRESLKQSKLPGKESYARYCKALVRAGGSAGFDRVLGLPLEIVPAADPWKTGNPSFRVLYRGKPLPDARVELMNLRDLNDTKAASSDGEGKVSFKIPTKGKYMIAVTHMVRATKPVKGDWESLWATLSFERTPDA